jgi:hypothetical protein
LELEAAVPHHATVENSLGKEQRMQKLFIFFGLEPWTLDKSALDWIQRF